VVDAGGTCFRSLLTKSNAMKTLLLSFSFFILVSASAQITTPVVKAFFGVDADLKSRSVNGAIQSSDDWFLFPGTSGTTTNGTFVIDTTGAAALVAAYAADVSPYPKRMSTFFKTMSQPSFSVINNRLWLDAIFVRDYHGNDTTVFTAGSDKNGMSPEFWSGGVQGIPDKNDILDMYVHVRRAGPTSTDSLWMFGGLSLDNVTGNRYFDFEMYQTDINYDRKSARWYGYGADAGHTSWQFDAAGNITRPGDIIFSAEYQSSSLTNIEARIWIDKASLSVTPNAFNWSGQFDGASTGAQYGYASILPKTAGMFYTGLQCGANEWAGAFKLILQDNSVQTNYIGKQFMEFSVNLTKLGLDPVTLLGGDICGSPFNRIVVKTRASSSFTAELKDFVAPLDLFLAPRVDVAANVPMFCGVIGASDVLVRNPSPTSVYTWTTADGHISGGNIGQKITVDAPGTYIVKQQLAAGCSAYAYDTITIKFDAGCWPLETGLTAFNGALKKDVAALNWTTKANSTTAWFEIERSVNGTDFETIGKVDANASESNFGDYSFNENIAGYKTPLLFYRLRIRSTSGTVKYSSAVKLKLQQNQVDLSVFPNPANNQLDLFVPSQKMQQSKIVVYDCTGAMIYVKNYLLKEGDNSIQFNTATWKTGSYLLNITVNGQNLSRKFIVSHG
jgi:hypothetical protein